MPTFEITTSKEDLFARAMSGGRVLATMLYPTDRVTRERVVGLWGVILNQFPGSGQPANLFQITTIETLSRHYTLVERQWRTGMAAGRILRLVRQINTHRPKSEASVGKAIHILTRSPSILGEPMKRTALRKAWSDFKPVAHLWVAADQLASCGGIDRPDQDQILHMHRIIIDNGGLLQMVVSIAEEWRQFGETFQTRQGTPLLDPTETWLAPEIFDLIENYPVVPPLSQDEIRHLETYMAPAHY